MYLSPSNLSIPGEYKLGTLQLAFYLPYGFFGLLTPLTRALVIRLSSSPHCLPLNRQQFPLSPS